MSKTNGRRKNKDQTAHASFTDDKDCVAAFLLHVEHSECLEEEVTNYMVEVPRKDHKIPEVVEAKRKEMENLVTYDTFEEVKDEGQERIGSRWVITKKEKHDGQKQEYKARLVARGFQEKEKPQSDSPTILRESFKMFVALSANEDFEIASVDIRAAFLQSKTLQRNVFVKPPNDIEEQGVLLILKKSLYGLNDASRRFWLRVKGMFSDQGLKVLPGDEAFYYRRENDNLVGMISTHVDDFSISGTKSFVLEIIRKIKGILAMSKVEWNSFRFTGIDVKKTAEGIEMSMSEYADSLEIIKNIRKGKKDECLTKVELKLFRKYTGKFNWLAENCRPDLAFVALHMAKKSNSATLGDLKKINVVI